MKNIFNKIANKIAPVKEFIVEENSRRAVVRSRNWWIGRTIRGQFSDEHGQTSGAYYESILGYTSTNAKKMAENYCKTGIISNK
ncbi:MAG: hypothetical protein HY052_07770 [Proteobacteria bacterium]|nr:hypothetical protein [Pseudomonadota bacterium]